MKAIFLILFLAIASCNTDIQEPKEQILEMNASGFMKCLTEDSPIVPNLMEVGESITTGEWTQALVQSAELVSRGYPVVKECVSAFTEEPSLTLKGKICIYVIICITIRGQKKCSRKCK